ncbi:MAG: hypothetical protein IIA67_05325 [Planctomycetes bacterium]|nr:hypothetical protein [Planctomycetota bacterium]
MSVEDEWQRDPDATGNLDLLFVTYDPQKIGVEKLTETITNTKHKFEVEVR